MPTEEERAAAYRAQQVRRKNYKLVQERRMAGNPVAAKAVKDGWAAFRDWTRERRGR